MPLAQVRAELEKLGFRDLPEHLLVSFMQSILSEEAANTAASDAGSDALSRVSEISEARDGSYLRSNGGSSTQSAAATLASAALKTRVSGRKVTILSPSKDLESLPRQTDVQEHRTVLPPAGLQQEQPRAPNTAIPVPVQRRSSADVHSNPVSSQACGHDARIIHSVPSAHAVACESAHALQPPCAAPASDENTVPASQRLDAANNALRAAMSCKSSTSSLKSHSSSVIFSSAPARPRSRHDPVKAFQNHASTRATPPALAPHIIRQAFSFNTVLMSGG
jgi:hypothetical protein